MNLETAVKRAVPDCKRMSGGDLDGLYGAKGSIPACGRIAAIFSDFVYTAARLWYNDEKRRRR